MIGWIIGALSCVIGLLRLLSPLFGRSRSPEQAAADRQAKVDEPLINRPSIQETEDALDRGKF